MSGFPKWIPHRTSELTRKLGIQLSKSFGLINCPSCRAVLDVGKRQQTRKCGKCGKRFWLDKILPFYSHDDREMVRRVRAGIMGWVGSGRYFVPTWLFGKWEQRADDQAEMRRFYNHLPWNLQARRVESTSKTPNVGDADCANAKV